MNHSSRQEVLRLHEQAEKISDYDPTLMSEWAVNYRKNLRKKFINRAKIVDAENK